MAVKVGDIIDFSLEIEIDIPKEDEGKQISVNDYKREYNVTYQVYGTPEYNQYYLDSESGEIPIEDDIKDLVKYVMENEYKEVTKYEILELNSSEYDHQDAKVKIVAMS